MKKLIIGLGAFVLLGLTLHFVPFDSRQGFLAEDKSCVTYYVSNGPDNLDYRWITGGVNKWDDQLSRLKEAKISPNSVYNCDRPVRLRLYLL